MFRLRCVFVCVNIKLIKGVAATNGAKVKGRKMEKVKTLWGWLVDAGIITDDLQLITDANGFTIMGLGEALYTHENKQKKGAKIK